MSVEAQHTPGPWFVCHDVRGSNGIGIADGDSLIVEHGAVRGWDNARLIAAAPDMLEAMRAIRRETHEIAVMNSPMHGLATPLIGIAQLCFNLANAAIAKATGAA